LKRKQLWNVLYAIKTSRLETIIASMTQVNQCITIVMTFRLLRKERNRRNNPIPKRAKEIAMKKKSYVVSESGVKVFSKYQDNITIDKDNPALKKKADYPRERYTRGKVQGLSRLGSENSEDARSWNFFRTLQLQSDMQKYYRLITVQDNLQNLLFWGLDPQTGEFDGVLKSILDEIEPPHLWKVQQTEPDVIVIGQKTIVFNECKLGKPGANIDAWNRKGPFTGKHELYKSRALSFFRQPFIDNFEAEARRFYQLMRNYIIGEHLANRLSKVFHLVAIASAQNKARSGLSHEEEFNKFCSYLFDSSRCHFLTWEQFEGGGCHA